MGRNKKLQEIDLSLNSLVIFRKLLTHDVILPLRALLDTESMDPMIQLRQYTEFISRLYARSTNLTEFIFQLICEDDNFYVREAANGGEIDEMLSACVQNELAILQRLARIRPHELQKEVSYYGVLPEWKTSDLDFGAEYHARLREIGKHGYGLFARHPMFIWRDEQIVPIGNPDPVTMPELLDCDAQKQAVSENVRMLLNGFPAQNMLFFGDAGTGKSAMAKAAVNTFYPDGLRLVEITQRELPRLPEIMEQVCKSPLKFLLFTDDLMASPADGSIGMLKSVLEGSAAVRAKNAVICATAGRSMTDLRNAEVQALTERFGLRIEFSRPDMQGFLHLAEKMAARCGLHMRPDEFTRKAEDYAAQNGTSPRAAKQLTEQLAGQAECKR